MLVYFGVGCPLPQNRETEKKNGCPTYNPNDWDIESLFFVECLMYPVFDFSLFHLPWISMIGPGMSFSEAIVAPPALIL